jgi:hypothetical protein
MSRDQFASPHCNLFDIEEIRQFWDTALRRIKAYAESGKAARQPTLGATGDSEALADADDGSCEGDGG